MADGYKKGYDKGSEAAESGKDRNLRPPIGEAVVKGKNFTNTYLEGYKDGYRDAKQKKQ